jgi:hypothetical protein
MNQANPPILARAMLWLCLPENDLQTIRGDLDEEFVTFALPNAGAASARSWYMRQAWKSLPYAFSMRGRTTEIPSTVLLAYLSFLVPIAFLNALRTYVLSQIPLKADSVHSTEFLIATLALGMFATLLSGFSLPSNRRVAVFRTSCLLALASAVLALLAAIFPTSVPIGWYPCSVLFLGAAGALIGATLRTQLSAREKNRVRRWRC